MSTTTIRHIISQTCATTLEDITLRMQETPDALDIWSVAADIRFCLRMAEFARNNIPIRPEQKTLLEQLAARYGSSDEV